MKKLTFTLLGVGVILIGCGGSSNNNQKANSSNNSNQPPVLEKRVSKISAGWYHTCAVVAKGNTTNVKCWGDNSYGELGDGTTTNSTTPVTVIKENGTPLSDIKDISASRYYTCALTNSGNVWCWGYNEGGKLGDGKLDKTLGGTLNQYLQQFIPFDDEKQSLYPVKVLTDKNIALNSVFQISAGSWHSCALLKNKTVKCWGQNFDGALGIGLDPNSFNYNNAQNDINEFKKLFWPYAINVVESNNSQTPLSNVKQIAAGSSDHTCALLNDGKVRCWAWNGGSEGQLGIDDLNTTFAVAPADYVKDENGVLSNVKEISAGGDFTCALLNSGKVKCWGWNSKGQIGDKTTNNASHAVAVKDGNGNDLVNVKAIFSERGNHTCALKHNEEMVCWGDNTHGQLGIGSSGKYVNYAIKVNTSNIEGNITSIAVGGGGRDPLSNAIVQYNGDHTCVLTDKGKVYCWGSNNKGQLGDGTTEDKNLPVEVEGL